MSNTLAAQKEQVKGLIDKLNVEELQALQVILKSIVYPEDVATAEELQAAEEGRKEILLGKYSKAKDVWRELGV